MRFQIVRSGRLLAATFSVCLAGTFLCPPDAFAQDQPAQQVADSDSTPQPLDADEMEVLVARIALYPDELVAVISAASLYPLQIVEADRYLDAYAKDSSLKPKDSWDGSVISLLNYPEIVGMMSEDLTWTQQLAEALAYQQKDVLMAIQQLREEAVAKGIIKTDDKVKVEVSNDNIVIQSSNPDTVYVPRYEPEMLYVPDYAPAPIAYYPDPYPNYWLPGATFFAATVTGALWAGAVDWDDWGVWGGPWRGDVDVDFDCNHCLNNINGKVNFRDVDWKNVDRSKLNIDRNQFANIDRSKIKGEIKSNRGNSVKNRATDIKGKIGNGAPGRDRPAISQDIRKSTLDGLKGKGPNQSLQLPDRRPDLKRPSGDKLAARPDLGKQAGGKLASRPATGQARPNIKNPPKIDRPVGKPRPAAKLDSRPAKPTALGNMDRGKVAKVQSNRGKKSISRGGGGGRPAVKRPAGRRR
ncbi:MAG: DUF3300 domain-containing protein [Rhizobiaceae bacterium]|nr:DUF3300 domain-containing protein [Rhizobiaceae bacterium]